jgi:hypothetical protein
MPSSTAPSRPSARPQAGASQAPGRRKKASAVRGGRLSHSASSCQALAMARSRGRFSWGSRAGSSWTSSTRSSLPRWAASRTRARMAASRGNRAGYMRTDRSRALWFTERRASRSWPVTRGWIRSA